MLIVPAILASIALAIGARSSNSGDYASEECESRVQRRHVENASALLQAHASKLERTWKISRQARTARISMFVAVMIERAAPAKQRAALRDLWKGVNDETDGICMRFAICNVFDKHKEVLKFEQDAHGDILLLDCTEGYGEGLLTKKLIKITQAYRHANTVDHNCLGRDLFMKIDADTFVFGYQLRQTISTAIAKHGSESLYAGVIKGPTDVKRGGFWIEPCENWANSKFPASMEGGPGYVLGRSLVARIVDDGLPEKYFLWNEDKAVGVWIELLRRQGVRVDWFDIPGTTGFPWDKPITSGQWGAYPYALQHHLSAACITCLAELDRNKDTDALVDACFQLDPLPERDFHANRKLEESALPCNSGAVKLNEST